MNNYTNMTEPKIKQANSVISDWKSHKIPFTVALRRLTELGMSYTEATSLIWIAGNSDNLSD